MMGNEFPDEPRPAEVHIDKDAQMDQWMITKRQRRRDLTAFLWHFYRRQLLTILAVMMVGVALVIVLSGCSPDSKGDAPEPTPDSIVNGTSTQVIRMPDGFRNVAVTCYGTNGVYVTSRGTFQTGSKDFVPLASGLFVVPNDPHCGR